MQVTIFHLHRGDGSSIFLHPLNEPGEMVGLSVEEGSELQGRYGGEPRVESFTLLRNTLYERVDEDIRWWLSERLFPRTFLISATVFLLSYFLLSFAVRDPLPIIDETIVSLVIACVLFFSLRRKGVSKNHPEDKRTLLRELIDRVVFQESRLLRELEHRLQLLDGMTRAELVSQLEARGVPPITEEEPNREARELLNYLSARFTGKRVKKVESGILLNRDRRWVGLLPRQLDLPLFTIYMELKMHMVECDNLE